MIAAQDVTLQTSNVYTHLNQRVSDVKQRYVTKQLLSYQQDVHIPALTVTLSYISPPAPSDIISMKDKQITHRLQKDRQGTDKLLWSYSGQQI